MRTGILTALRTYSSRIYIDCNVIPDAIRNNAVFLLLIAFKFCIYNLFLKSPQKTTQQLDLRDTSTFFSLSSYFFKLPIKRCLLLIFFPHFLVFVSTHTRVLLMMHRSGCVPLSRQIILRFRYLGSLGLLLIILHIHLTVYIDGQTGAPELINDEFTDKHVMVLNIIELGVLVKRLFFSLKLLVFFIYPFVFTESVV